jgi:hypothetical protein
MFQTNVVAKMKHILSSVHFSLQSCHLWVNEEKYGRGRQATLEIIMLRRKKTVLSRGITNL